jgi:prenyltransferase beta subunit
MTGGVANGSFVSFLSEARSAASIHESQEAIRALSILRGLGNIDVEAVINFTIHCQDPNGGFTGSPLLIGHITPEILSTSDAISVLYELGATGRVLDRNGLINFVVGCYRPDDGAFSHWPGLGDTDLMNVYCGLNVLHCLGASDKIDGSKVTDYILGFYQSDGGFSTFPGPGRVSTVVDTRYGLMALNTLGALDRIDREKSIDWILQVFYHPEKGYFEDGVGVGLSASIDAVLELGMLTRLDRVNRSGVVDVVLRSQNSEHGGFFPYLRSDLMRESGSSTWYAAEILAAFNALDTLEENITVSHHSVWTGDPADWHPQDNGGAAPGLSFSPLTAILLVISVSTLVLSVYNLSKLEKKRKKNEKAEKTKMNHLTSNSCLQP